MDAPARRYLARIAHSVSSRIPKLSRDGLYRRKEKLRAVVLLMLAAVLGIHAYGVSCAEAEREFHRTHIPSEMAWQAAFASQPFVRVAELHKLHQAARTLPSAIDAKGAVWATADREWIAVFVDPERPVPFDLWCRSCDPPKAGQWQPLGKGWPAFDRAQHEIAKMKPLARMSIKSLAPVSDPREIRY